MTTMTKPKKQLSRRRSRGTHYPLEAGFTVSIQGKSDDPLAATVTKVSSDGIWLKLCRPGEESAFQDEEQVRIKYWDESAVAYYWDAEVLKTSGLANEYVTILLNGVGVTVQRRKSSRTSTPVRFTLTVVDASNRRLTGEKVVDCETNNISVGGLLFETYLPLEVGDTIEMSLFLCPPDRINALGWVVRSQRIDQDGKGLHSVAVQFLHLEEFEQNAVLSFLAEAESFIGV